ncbi:MAG: hypothetical protein V3T77_04445 [Planctomycetota bacterium]
MAASPNRIKELGALAVAAILAPYLGVLVGTRWLLPLLGTFSFLPIFLQLVRKKSVTVCLAGCMLWAFLYSATCIILAHGNSPRYEAAVIHGAEYRQEMFRWLETGEGAEGDPARFVPNHLLHFAAFLVLVILTRGVGGLLLGVMLLDYMNAYVGALAREGNPWLLALLGWHPWAILRVTGFLLAAILWVRPMENGKKRRKQSGWKWVFLLLACDLLLKWWLAPTWRELIRSQLGG